MLKMEAREKESVGKGEHETENIVKKNSAWCRKGL
jgi:hypothetical protein